MIVKITLTFETSIEIEVTYSDQKYTRRLVLLPASMHAPIGAITPFSRQQSSLRDSAKDYSFIEVKQMKLSAPGCSFINFRCNLNVNCYQTLIFLNYL